jgi:methylenetetrahydrofolate dehydrogenase (NADP+) / methenyltetrahydrofolate cyclohydrolase
VTAQIIDGKKIAEQLEHEIRKGVADLTAKGIVPGLTVLRVGEDPASEVYVRSKEKKAAEFGFNGRQVHLPATISQDDLLARINELNADPLVDGILLQLPLPDHLDAKLLLDTIDPAKDVDGFHPVNVGRLLQGRPCLVACTPLGVIHMIETCGITIKGANAVVVGRSDIVGKPVAVLLMHRHATVTIAHSRTRNLADVVRQADIVVAAVGKPHMVTGDMIKPGAAVLDVGINRIDASFEGFASLSDKKRKAIEEKGSALVGDVEFESASKVAGWITPVPGGVGPMTIMLLMKNTLQAARDRRG